jgi:hypothetical protein
MIAFILTLEQHGGGWDLNPKELFWLENYIIQTL